MQFPDPLSAWFCFPDRSSKSFPARSATWTSQNSILACSLVILGWCDVTGVRSKERGKVQVPQTQNSMESAAQGFAMSQIGVTTLRKHLRRCLYAHTHAAA